MTPSSASGPASLLPSSPADVRGVLVVGAGQMGSGIAQVFAQAGRHVQLVDVSAESARLKKELGKLDGEIGKIDAKLGNPQFVSKAPEEVIEEQKERREEARAAKAKLEAALARLATLKS